jgi:hypothetical protein
LAFRHRLINGSSLYRSEKNSSLSNGGEMKQRRHNEFIFLHVVSVPAMKHRVDDS